MRKRALLSVVPTIALLLAGCQTAPPASPSPSEQPAAGDNSTTEAAPPAPANRPACTLAPAALIKSTLGMNVSEPTESYDATEIECTYRPANNGLTVVVKFRTDQDSSTFAMARRESDQTGEPTMDVNGVGDQAYATSVEFGDTVTNTLVARKGSVVMLVTAPTPIDAEKSLITRVFSSL